MNYCELFQEVSRTLQGLVCNPEELVIKSHTSAVLLLAGYYVASAGASPAIGVVVS